MSINPEEVYEILKQNNINFFCGVPDSILKSFTNFIDYKVNEDNHVITANEGNAIALATGYHLKNDDVALVYFQNSGLGNCINPLTSLTNKEVYSIPIILFIGWRGSPGLEDEPQHIKQGEILEKQLDLLGIKFIILEEKKNMKKSISDLINFSRKNSVPVAILVKNGTISNFISIAPKSKFQITKSDIIRSLIPKLNNKDLVFCTTGMISRSILDFLTKTNTNSKNFFFNVGSMGHVSSIAFGAAISKKNRVFCFDGDGSFLMHMGALAVIGSRNPKNFKYILINNGCHESVGGQKTAAFKINIKEIANGLGFKYFKVSKGLSDMKFKFEKILHINEPCFFEIKVKTDEEKKLPRPSKKLVDYKNKFMRAVKQIE